jgi:hypothetical protein
MYTEVSITMPVPIALPAIEVPPPRSVTGILDSFAIESAEMISAESLGITTSAGGTR